MRHFFAHVAGESHRNADGSDRQAIIPRCHVGELLALEHEPDNPHDINAIRVLRQTGEQIGYLQREFAGEVVSRSAKGYSYHAVISGFGRARVDGPYGVSLLIIVGDEGDSDAEVVAYAQRVLAKDRDIEVERATPRSSGTTGVSSDVFVTIAVVIALLLALLVVGGLMWR